MSVNRLDFSIIPTNDGDRHAHELCGWTPHPTLKEDNLRDFKPLHIVGAAPVTEGRSALYEVGRKVIGKDPDNYPQEIGDCCSFGEKNAIEYMQFYPMAAGENDIWTEIFPPYCYGTARVNIGGERSWGDGSLGVWQAKSAMQYGVVSTKDSGYSYSGKLAKSWGYYGVPKELIPIGQKHLVKSTALVSTWEQLLQALMNGYPVTVASDVGFDMKMRSDGYMHYSTSWPHQMCFTLIDTGDTSLGIEPHVGILNSWGDVFGEIKDFRTGEIWPKGMIRARKKDAVTMLNAGDAFAYSSLNGFPAQTLPRNFFDIF